MRGEGLWPDRQFEVNFSVQFFGRESGCHMDNVQHTWYQQPSPKPRSCRDFRNTENNSFFFCQHLLLSQNFSSWAKWGLFSLCVLQRLTKQHSTPVFLLPKRAIPLCPVVKVCDVTLDTLVPHQCHKVLWEGGVLELTAMEFLDSHHLSSPFTNRNTSQRGEKKYIERLGIEL